MKGIGKEVDRLFIFSNTITINDVVMITKRSNLIDSVPYSICDSIVDNANLDIVLWHKRLGNAYTHVPRKKCL